MLNQDRVIISLDGGEPWQTERRSSDWIIGDGPPLELNTADLALVPVASVALGCGRPDPIVASLSMDRPLDDLPWRRPPLGNA